MKFYLSVDLEGISGVNSVQQLSPNNGDRLAYEEAVTQMALETQVVCEALIAEDEMVEIVVNDAHTHMTNLGLTWFQHLPQVQLISGKPKPFAMMYGLDSSFDAALLLGYHAKSGTLNGTLAHSYHTQIFDLTLNGESVGEAELNTVFANVVHQVPVILYSGDDVFQNQMQAFAPKAGFVKTKQGLGFYVAQHPDNEIVLDNYQATVKQQLAAKANWKKDLKQAKAPFNLQVTFTQPVYADIAALNPLWRRVDGRTVLLENDDLEFCCRQLQLAYTLLAAVPPLP